MNWQEFFNLVLEFLKVIIVWPVAAVLIALLLRRPIANVLEKRSMKVKAAGAEIELGGPQMPIPPPKSITGTTPTSVSSDVEMKIETKPSDGTVTPYGYVVKAQLGTSAMIEEQVKILEKDLEAVGTSQKFREEVLIRAVAKNQILVEFEKLVAVVYRSQIMALASLAMNVQEFQEIGKVQEFYENAKRTWPDAYKKIPFENWLGFLENSLLLKKVPEQGNKIAITVRGSEFTNWVATERKEQVQFMML